MTYHLHFWYRNGSNLWYPEGKRGLHLYNFLVVWKCSACVSPPESHIKTSFLARINYILLHSLIRFFSLKAALEICPIQGSKRMEKSMWGSQPLVGSSGGCRGCYKPDLTVHCRPSALPLTEAQVGVTALHLLTSTFWIHNQSQISLGLSPPIPWNKILAEQSNQRCKE